MQSIEFLRLFKHSMYTLAHFNGKSMRSFPCKPENLEKALGLLHKKYTDQEIYFMVNEGDGVLNDKKTACHSTENVKNLSALFLDAELVAGDPLPNILAFCNQYFFTPSITVKTSENRYHIYWLFQNAYPATPEVIAKWQQLQFFLHSKLSIDRTMTDIPQVLRIPGFYNQKKKCDVEVIQNSPVTITLDSAYEALKKQFPEIDRPTHTPLPPITDDYKIPEGERHEELVRRCRKFYNLPLTDLEIKYLLYGVIKNHVTNPSDFLPGGKRHQETERILSSCKGYAEAERQQELANSITKHTEIKKSKSAFELDPEFYYNAPGIVGELTKFFVDTSQTPIPAHAFAAAVSLVGFTKARYIQGHSKLPPINYFLCLAPSGSGKTTIQHMIKSIFKQLQISHLVEDGIASAQGLIQFLHESNGLGFVIYDEVKDLFQTISSKFAASYEVKISTELTKLYTAYKSTYIPPTTKTHKGKKIVLSKPILSFIGYGQHVLIDQLFSKSNVTDGLLPRFIILNVNEKTDRQALSRTLPNSILDELQSNVTKSCIAVEEKQDPNTPVIAPLIKTLSLSHDAQVQYQKFDNSRTQLYNQATAEKNGLEALFSRGSEQVLRLSLAMSDSQIQPTILDFCITLINSQMNNFYEQFSKTANRTEYAKEADELLEAIIELCSESSDYTVSRRDVQRKLHHRFKARGLFSKQIDELIEQEKIIEFEKTQSSGQKQKRLKLGDVTP